MTPLWFRDGKAADKLPINDRGLQYADGLFETIAIRDGKPRHWGLHVERLQTGCCRLGMESPSADELLKRVSEAIARTRNETHDALLKIIVTRGEGARGYAPPAGVRPTAG